MKVTEIETHSIGIEYQDWQARALNHYYGPSTRVIYVVHTDDGKVGLGEGGGREPQEIIDRYIGTNPFDWTGDETSLALGTAMYDLMGQAANVPVYKLIGQKHRSWVPVGSWTVSTHPDRMAETARRHAEMGYTWMKFHLSPFENVIAQTEAIQEAVPAGFRIHYDFTMHGTNDHMIALLSKLQEYPVAGCFEDPLPGRDIEGYIELRKRSRLPIVLHHSELGFSHDVLMGAADAYMLGHWRIGDAIGKAGLFAAGNIPFMLQNTGGTITRAMTAHMMAAFPSANFHFIDASETGKDDVVAERLEPVNGFVRVPEKPGLGLTLKRGELKRLASRELPEQPPWIIKSEYANGTQMYNKMETSNPLFMVLPVRARILPPMSYDQPISTEYWDNDGSAEFREMFARIEREGVVLEKHMPTSDSDSGPICSPR